MCGRVCIVTGCNTGIGLETAGALARAGATLVFAARSFLLTIRAQFRGGVSKDGTGPPCAYFECWRNPSHAQHFKRWIRHGDGNKLFWAFFARTVAAAKHFGN